jgi:hypothetical protein
MLGSESGVALLFAVSALAALGFLTLTALSLARIEAEAGLRAIARVQARGAAEAALSDALLGWPSSSTPLVPGGETLLSQVNLPGPAHGRASVRALGGPVYALRALGSRRAAGGQLLAAVQLELLVLPGAPDSNSVVHPRVYPRGWRIPP